jgi:hypothetical protein
MLGLQIEIVEDEVGDGARGPMEGGEGGGDGEAGNLVTGRNNRGKSHRLEEVKQRPNAVRPAGLDPLTCGAFGLVGDHRDHCDCIDAWHDHYAVLDFASKHRKREAWCRLAGVSAPATEFFVPDPAHCFHSHLFRGIVSVFARSSR